LDEFCQKTHKQSFDDIVKEARKDKLRTLKRNRAVISGITYKRPGVADKVLTGKIVEISKH